MQMTHMNCQAYIISQKKIECPSETGTLTLKRIAEFAADDIVFFFFFFFVSHRK